MILPPVGVNIIRDGDSPSGCRDIFIVLVAMLVVFGPLVVLALISRP